MQTEVTTDGSAAKQRRGEARRGDRRASTSHPPPPLPCSRSLAPCSGDGDRCVRVLQHDSVVSAELALHSVSQMFQHDEPSRAARILRQLHRMQHAALAPAHLAHHPGTDKRAHTQLADGWLRLTALCPPAPFPRIASDAMILSVELALRTAMQVTVVPPRASQGDGHRLI